MGGYPPNQMPYGGLYPNMQNSFNLMYNQVNPMGMAPAGVYNPPNDYGRQAPMGVPNMMPSASNSVNMNANSFGKGSQGYQNFAGSQNYQNNYNEPIQPKQNLNYAPQSTPPVNTKVNAAGGNAANANPQPFGAPIKLNNLKTNSTQQGEQPVKKATKNTNQDSTTQQANPKTSQTKSNNKKVNKTNSKQKDKKVDEDILKKEDEFPKLG